MWAQLQPALAAVFSGLDQPRICLVCWHLQVASLSTLISSGKPLPSLLTLSAPLLLSLSFLPPPVPLTAEEEADPNSTAVDGLSFVVEDADEGADDEELDAAAIEIVDDIPAEVRLLCCCCCCLVGGLAATNLRLVVLDFDVVCLTAELASTRAEEVSITAHIILLCL